MTVTTAVEKLRLSTLIERPGLNDEVDLRQLSLALAGSKNLPVRELVTEASLSMTIEGASTFTVTLIDRDLVLTRSDRLQKGLDTQIDGLYFRLANFKKTEDQVTLVFEDREVAIMRLYTAYTKVSKDTMNRFQFIVSLVRGVRELAIPIVCPELEGGIPPKAKTDRADSKKKDLNRALGLQFDAKFTVKIKQADAQQKEMAERILDVGVAMHARRKVLVAAMMTAIQESTLRNLDHGDRDSLGLFQQRASWGSAQNRQNPEWAAGEFFKRAIAHDAADPIQDPGNLAQDVQVSAFPDAYAQWRTEAERIVSLYGLPGGDESTAADVAAANRVKYAGQFDFGYSSNEWARGSETTVNGKPKVTHESTWDATGRLVDEVQARRYMVAGHFFLFTEEHLFKSKPQAQISQDDDGIDSIDADVDINKDEAELTVQAHIGRWVAPPGSVIQVVEMGRVMNGKWLVSQIDRDIFSSKATITLVKPRPLLPEPVDENAFFFGQQQQQEGVNLTAPGQDNTILGDNPIFTNNRSGSRSDVVAVAYLAYEAEQKQHYKYLQERPYPGDLFDPATAMRGIDCSAFAILVCKHAGAQDPSGHDFNGSGFTGDIDRVCKRAFVGQPGDLVMWGDPNGSHGHVGVYVGGLTEKSAVGAPLFTKEGPEFYTAALAHNSGFAVAGPYQTTLTGPQETAFRAWLTARNVPFDFAATIVDYDMRGYWKNIVLPGGTWTGGHFPDTYKTPYDTSFSKESIYATGANPFEWRGEKLIDTRDGSIVFWADYKPEGTSANLCIEIGSQKGILKIDANYRTDNGPRFYEIPGIKD